MKISIAMTYYDRFEQLKQTINSISNHTKPDEIIIVDDGSINQPLSNKLINEISKGLNIILYRFDPEDKTWINPSIPYNKAFSLCSTGDVIIIQNSECWHRDDIVGYCKNLDFNNNYYVFGCYSLGKNTIPDKNLILNNRAMKFDGDESWYQHGLYNPSCFHFISAISKNNLYDLGGFDENYGDAIGFDDNEFLYRIRQKLNIVSIDDYITFHQYHYNENSKNIQNSKTNADKFMALTNNKYVGFKTSLSHTHKEIK